MKKKAYITPELLVVNVAPQTICAVSGGGTNATDPIIDPLPDTNNDPSNDRSRSNNWDDEEEEDYDF